MPATTTRALSRAVTAAVAVVLASSVMAGSVVAAAPATAATAIAASDAYLNKVGAVLIVGDPWVLRDGPPDVGELLIAWYDGDWMPGTVLTRQWMRNGQPIPGATKENYTLTNADIGAVMSFTVTGTRPGNTTRTITSRRTDPVVASRPSVVNSAKPSFTGTGLIGQPLKANPGSWTPGTKLTYEWVSFKITAEGKTWPTVIQRGPSPIYVPTDADDGYKIYLVTTGKKEGFDPLMVGEIGNRQEVEIHKALVVPAEVRGVPRQGETLSIRQWKSGAALSYQWKRNGAAIPGATGETYKTGNGDAGKRITVTVTGKLAGHPTVSATSAPSEEIWQEQTYMRNIPVFSWYGTFRGVSPGDTVKLTTPGTWSKGAKVSYRWYRDGKAIRGATGTSFKLTAADVGKKIHVKVTAQTPDYLKVVHESMTIPFIRAKAPEPVSPWLR